MTRKKVTLVLSTLLIGSGCALNLSIDDDCSSGLCDNSGKDDADGPDSTCVQLLRDRSGNNASDAEILDKRDPIAEIILANNFSANRNVDPNLDSDGDGIADGKVFCPMSVADIVEELKRSGACEETTHGTQMVSERSQVLERFTDYRAITEIQCGGRDVFLHYPITAPEIQKVEPSQPGAVEIDQERLLTKLDTTFPAIIAEDVDGMFNFYQSQTNGEDFAANFSFFGNSMDYVSKKKRIPAKEGLAAALPVGGADEHDVDASLKVPGNCAGCHPNGGLTMRELRSPWIHWEGGRSHFESPLDSDIVEAAPETLGRIKTGASFEPRVRNANVAFNAQRLTNTLSMLSQGRGELTTGDLLRPIVCSDEFNIDTSGGRPGTTLSTLPFGGPIVDETLLEQLPSRDSSDRPIPRSISNKNSDPQGAYENAIEAQNWLLAGFREEPFATLLGLVGKSTLRETMGNLTFMHRAEIETDFQEKLVQAGVLRQDTVNALLSVDFTRGVFSLDRCGLASLFEEISPSIYLEGNGSVIPGALDDEIFRLLDSPENDAQADLKRALENPNTVLEEVGAFMQACDAQPADDMLNNYVSYLSQVRKVAANKEFTDVVGLTAYLLLRFPGTNGFIMPEAIGLEFDGSVHLDPKTCDLLPNND